MSTYRIALANIRFPVTPVASITLAEHAIAQASLFSNKKAQINFANFLRFLCLLFGEILVTVARFVSTLQRTVLACCPRGMEARPVAAFRQFPTSQCTARPTGTTIFTRRTFPTLTQRSRPRRPPRVSSSTVVVQWSWVTGDHSKLAMLCSSVARPGGAQRLSATPIIWVRHAQTDTTPPYPEHVLQICRLNIRLGAVRWMAASSGSTIRWSVACLPAVVAAQWTNLKPQPSHTARRSRTG